MSEKAISSAKPLFTPQSLKSLIIPLIIEQTLAMSIGFFDTMMVAYAGESAVSGVALVDSLNYLAINFFSAIAAGGAIVVAQYLGRQNKEKSNHAAKQLLLIVAFLSLLIASFCLLFNPFLLRSIFGNVESSVMDNAVTYFYLIASSFPFIAIFNVSAALFRGMGNSKTAMINAFIMNLINLIGNSIFIFVFKWGVFGAALATLISRIIGSISMMRMLRNPELPVHITSYGLRDMDVSMMKRILRIGVPNGLENSIFQIGKIIVTGLVATFSTASIAAHAVVNSLTGLEIIPGQALGLAIVTVVAQCIGAVEYEQAKHYTKDLMKRAILYLALLNLPLLFLMRPVLQLYSLSSESLDMAFQILLLHGIAAILIWPISFTLPNALRAAGDVVFPMFLSIFSMFAFRVGFSFLFASLFQMGLLSVWLAMFIDWAFRSICFTLRWRSGKWKRFSVV